MVFDQSERAQGPIYIIMAKKHPPVKFIRNQIRDSGAVFFIFSLVKISITYLILCLTLKLYLNVLVYDRLSRL